MQIPLLAEALAVAREVVTADAAAAAVHGRRQSRIFQ